VDSSEPAGVGRGSSEGILEAGGRLDDLGGQSGGGKKAPKEQQMDQQDDSFLCHLEISWD